ncbi:MAG TPA: PKD domain-containing protein [Thermoanaerobaculia bacterium]
MLKNRSIRLVATALCLLVGMAAVLTAQGNDCGVPLGTASTTLPAWSGTLPGSADMTLADSDNYLYVLTQWGFARAPLGDGSNPGPYQYVVMGHEPGTSSPGTIPVVCDCHQGSNTFDVAEAPDGSARLVSDWQPFAQGDGVSSGYPAVVAKAAGTGNPSFGNQIDLPDAVAPSAEVAAIYIATTGSYYGYFPVVNAGVYMADVTNLTGNLLPPIEPSPAISWASGSISGTGVRLRAAHVVTSSYDKYLLLGSTPADDVIHVAEINTSTGHPTEITSITGSAQGNQLDVAVVNNEIFIFAASGGAGLKVYKFTPPSLLSEVSVPSSISTGTIKKVDINGPAPFPAMSIYRDAGGGQSYVDIWDTKWLNGSQPIRARSIHHFGAGDASYRGNGFGSFVTSSSGTVTSHIYREVNPPPPGLPQVQSPIHTDKVDISCIAADPDAPPIPFANMTNVSAQGRPAPENTKNYFGDQWSIADASVSFLPILQLAWDFHYTGAFNPETVVTGTDLHGYTYSPAYWPCDTSAGGNITTGVGCYGSLGSIVGSYQLAMRAQNVNPPDNATFVSPAVTVSQPQVSIVGFDGNTLQVLAGNPNNGDASATQGNTNEATFDWNFSPGGAPSCTQPCKVVTVPTAATSFTLLVTYKGGYGTTVGGSIQQVDLVPNFSLTPNPVLKSSTLTLKNLMQKAAAATLNSVDYAITPSGGSGTLPGAFLVVNGTAGVTAPGSVGNYTVTLTYHYTDHLGAQKTAQVALPFGVTDFQPVPALGVYTDAAHSHKIFPAPGNPPSFNLTAGTQYYLFDDEPLPGGVAHPGAGFYTSSDNNESITAGDHHIGDTSNAGPQAWSAASCSGSCYFKVEVPATGGTVRAFKYVATSGGGGGNPPPPPTPTLTLSGPASGVVGQTVSFTATASNFPGAVTYAWDFGDGGGGGGGGGNNPPPPGGCPPITPLCDSLVLADPIVQALTPGPATNTHTYASVGTFTVTVQATSGSTQRTTTKSISITNGGPPPPLNTFNVTGASFNAFNNTWTTSAGVPVTFTATEPDQTTSFGWDFGDGSLPVAAAPANRVIAHSFIAAGSFTVSMTAANANGSSSGSVRFSVSPPSFQAVMIPGAGSIDSPSGVWATDISVTNPGNAATTVTLYFAAFTDDIPMDLSTLPFDSLNSFMLLAGQSWSGVDVVGDPQILNRHGAGKGLLLLKFTGVTAPIVSSRVYFTAQGASFGTALPSYVVGPYGQAPGLQGTEAAGDQILVGLRNDSLYRFNVSLFNASSQAGQFHLDAFTDQGEPVASRDFSVAAYDQAGINDTDLFTPDPEKRYVIKVSGSSGALQAFASVLDRRNNDLVQVADDTPRVAVNPGDTVNYYIAGVGRIEDAASNTHWRTDLRFFNTSTQARDLTFQFHYTAPGETADRVVLNTLHLFPGQGVSIDDFVGTFLNQASDVDLTTGTALGVLLISSLAPADIASAPLILGGRIYADLSTGTAGMQLSTYSDAQTVAAGGGALVMPGAQTNLRFRTNIGIFATSLLPTTVRITAVKQDGSTASTFDYTLNDPDHTGAFAQVPMTALAGIDGNPETIKVQSINGGSVGAYIVTVDQISADTVFVQGKQHD